MPNRFELKQLKEAAEKYTYHDAGTKGVWPRLVWERRKESPLAPLDDAVEFLDKWKGLRFKRGKIAFRRICSNPSICRIVRRKPLKPPPISQHF